MKRYRITRVTKEYVWLRWDAFGNQRRGLSTRIPMADFKAKWVRLPNKVAEKRIPLNDGKQHSFQCEYSIIWDFVVGIAQAIMRLMNYIQKLRDDNTEKGIALAKVQREINSFLCFLESSKFVGTENGERKDWIATGDVKHFLLELRQQTIVSERKSSGSTWRDYELLA